MTAVQVTWAEPKEVQAKSFSRVVDHYRMDSYKRLSQSTESMPEVVEPVWPFFAAALPFRFAAITATGWGASGVSTSVGLPGWSLKTSLITCIMLLRPSFSKLISSFASSNNPVNKRLFEPKSFPNAFLDAVLGQQMDHLYRLRLAEAMNTADTLL